MPILSPLQRPIWKVCSGYRRLIVGEPMRSGSLAHYGARVQLTEQLTTLWPKVSDETKERFERGVQVSERLTEQVIV